MLTQDKGVIKILDFGLAKVVSENKAAHGLTKTNVTMGTYEYTAPEQAWDAASADIRADIYSLGCTLYYLIAGQLPFNYQSDAQILMAHQSETPRPLCDVVPETPKELSDLVDRMLAKKPEDRPQTPREAAQELLPFAKGENVSPLLPGEGGAPAQRVGVRAGLLAGTPAPQRTRRKANAFPALLAGLSKHLKRPVVLVGLAAAGVAAVVLFTVVMSIHTSQGTVRIELSDPAAKVTVKVDGDTIDILGLKDPIRLTAGNHELLVESGDYKSATQSFTVEKNKTEVLKVTLEPNPVQKGPAIEKGDVAGRPEPPPVGLEPNTPPPRPGGPSIGGVRSSGPLCPADNLRREDISADELAAAGGGDPSKAPAELVAIFGDSRLKHWAAIRSVSYSGDGKTLVTGSEDGTVCLWDPVTGKLRWSVEGGAHSLSNDGKLLATGCDDKTVKLWDAESGRLLLTLDKQADKIGSLAFSPDGQLLAVATDPTSGKLVVWDVAAPAPADLQGYRTNVSLPGLQPRRQDFGSGQQAVVGSQGGAARLAPTLGHGQRERGSQFRGAWRDCQRGRLQP